ncbi:MAG: hypothetical protein ACOH10_12960 [Rhodoglobus sp.]
MHRNALELLVRRKHLVDDHAANPGAHGAVTSIGRATSSWTSGTGADRGHERVIGVSPALRAEVSDVRPSRVSAPKGSG